MIRRLLTGLLVLGAAAAAVVGVPAVAVGALRRSRRRRA